MAKKKYYAGYCDGKIAVIQNVFGFNTVELFANRKHAKRFFKDVRPVEIKEISKEATNEEQTKTTN